VIARSLSAVMDATAIGRIASVYEEGIQMKPKRVRIPTILFLATAGPLLQAQFGPPNGLYRPEAVSALIDRVHGDLNRGYEVWHLRGSDRGRLTHAEHQLRNFAQDWSRGKFDKDDLDESIAAIQHVLDNNHLTGRERDALWGDVENLRRMREAYDRHEIGRR
jgi:hypothetical protein